MFCPKCGNEVNDGAVFCPHCGANQGTAENSKAAVDKTPATKKKGKGGVIAVVILAVLVIAAGAGAYVYFNSDGYISKKTMELAEECFDSEEYEEALDHYAEALKLDASLTEAYIKSADILLLDEKYEEALKILEKGLKKTKDDEKSQDSIADKIEETNKSLELALSKELTGIWSLDYDLADLLAGELGEDFADFRAPLVMTICFEFRDDKTFTMYGEQDSFKANYNTWLDAFLAFATEMMYDEFLNQGLDRASADAAFEETYGISIEAYLRQTFEDEVNVDALLVEVTTNGKYDTSDGNKLYMAEDGEAIDQNAYDVYTIDGDILRLELPAGADPSQGDILPGLKYPLELQRANWSL